MSAPQKLPRDTVGRESAASEPPKGAVRASRGDQQRLTTSTLHLHLLAHNAALTQWQSEKKARDAAALAASRELSALQETLEDERR